MKCIVCNGSRTIVLFKNSDFIDKKKYRYIRCNECYVIFIDPLPSRKRLAEIYSFSNNKLESNANKLLFFLINSGLGKGLFEFLAKVVVKERARFVIGNSVKKRGTILDLGCGVAEFLKEMMDSKWKVAGQDISEKCIVVSKKLLGSKAKLNTNPISEQSLLSSADVVTMWHVFEHLPDFENVVTDVSRKMKSGAQLIMETPNANGLSLVLFGKYSPMIITPEHLVFWSPKGLTTILNRHNFKDLSITYQRTFMFTTVSAFFNLLKVKYSSTFFALFISALFLPVSLIIYFVVPRYNESIRVVAVKV